jgi:hypothetical protein
VKEYLATAAFGAASDVTPKLVSPPDPAAQGTGAMRGPAFFAYADKHAKFVIIMDVGTSRRGLTALAGQSIRLRPETI